MGRTNKEIVFQMISSLPQFESVPFDRPTGSDGQEMPLETFRQSVSAIAKASACKIRVTRVQGMFCEVTLLEGHIQPLPVRRTKSLMPASCRGRIRRAVEGLKTGESVCIDRPRLKDETLATNNAIKVAVMALNAESGRRFSAHILKNGRITLVRTE